MTHLKFHSCVRDFVSFKVAYNTLKFNFIVKKLKFDESSLRKKHPNVLKIFESWSIEKDPHKYRKQ